MFKSKTVVVFGSAAAAVLLLCSVSALAQTPAPKPVRVHAKLDGFDSGKPGGPKTQIGGASRGIGGLVLLAPASGMAYTLRPTFFWSGAEDMNATFKLMDAGGTVVFQQPVSASWLQYPANAPALTPGAEYKWTVTPEVDMVSGPKVPATIAIVGGDKRSTVAAELPGGGSTQDKLGQARSFVDARLWYDAIAAYTDLIAANPGMKVLYEERGTVYEQVPATKPLAAQDFEKAKKL